MLILIQTIIGNSYLYADPQTSKAWRSAGPSKDQLISKCFFGILPKNEQKKFDLRTTVPQVEDTKKTFQN